MSDEYAVGDDCPRCGNNLGSSPADDASAECDYCGFYEALQPDVCLPPLWREEPQLASRLGLTRLFAHIEGPGFIGVRGAEVELVRADLQAGEESDPEQYDEPLRDERAKRVEKLAEKYNEERTETATEAGENVEEQ